jgi:hypothetical protein
MRGIFHAQVVKDMNRLVRSVTPLSPVSAALPHPSMAKWPILNKMSGFATINNTFKEAFQGTLLYKPFLLKMILFLSKLLHLSLTA